MTVLYSLIGHGKTPLSALHTHSCPECTKPRGCMHRRSTQLEGQGTPRDKGRHSGFPSHVLESKKAIHSVEFLSPEQKPLGWAGG